MDNHIKAQPHVVEDDDITLTEMIHILYKRKQIILATTSLFLLCAIVYLVFAKPIYQSRSVVSIGQIGQDRQELKGGQVVFLEDPQILLQRIKEKYKVGDETEGKITLPALVSVELDKKNTNSTLILKANANNPEEARTYLIAITEELMNEHRSLYNTTYEIYQNQVQALEQRHKTIDQDIIDYNKKIRTANGQDGIGAMLLVMDKAKLAEQRYEIEKDLEEAKLRISKVSLKPTQILREASLPVSPQRSGIIIIPLSLIMGMVMGIALAMVKEYMVGRNKKVI